ncbi:hypothetical protein AMK13_15795 [Streptomyces sp. CB02056]|nr:hypothetical protein AMK13_15795 [Streptomyces sp. CB02056]
MGIEFTVVDAVPYEHGRSTEPLIWHGTATFSHPVKNAEAAIQAFSLEFLRGPYNPGEAPYGKEHVDCSVGKLTGNTAAVQVTFLLRPRDAGPDYNFQASARILVIAETGGM